MLRDDVMPLLSSFYLITELEEMNEKEKEKKSAHRCPGSAYFGSLFFGKIDMNDR